MNWLSHLLDKLKRPRGGRRRFLCETCIYNHPNSCRMAMRPHAVLCEDHVPRGEQSTLAPPPNLKL